METLEVLEQRLAEFNGTLIVVSHDREFLDNVVTSTIVFEEDGEIREYAGGYSDWHRKGRELAELDDPLADSRAKKTQTERTDTNKIRKLGFNEQRELDQLPQRIEELENRIAALLKKISSADFYSQNHAETAPVLKDYADSQQALDEAMQRWTELEDRQQQYEQSRN